MNDTLICDELCELDLDVRSTDEFFEVMSKKAVDLGYVTEQFLSAIKKREQDYPTALPVKPYPVAIPHSDPINIVKQFIAPVRLKNAISWCEMANNDSILSVQIVFLLGFKRDDGKLAEGRNKGRISGNSEANGRTLMKKVIVACGNGVATSQTVAFRINRMLEKENITNVRVEAVNLRSLQRELHGALA